MHSLILSQCSDLRMDVSFNHNTYKTVLNLLEAVYLRFRKIEVERVTVVTFRVDNRGSDGTGCFRIKVRMDTAELTNMRIAVLRKWWDLTRESKIFIRDKTKVVCRMSGIAWRVVYFRNEFASIFSCKFLVLQGFLLPVSGACVASIKTHLFHKSFPPSLFLFLPDCLHRS